MKDLACLYLQQKRLPEAEDMCKRVLGFKYVPRDIVVQCHICLGATYRAQGRINDAEELFSMVLSKSIRDHRQTHISSRRFLLDAVIELGRVNCAQAKFKEAEEVYTSALEGHKGLFLGKHLAA